MAIFRSQLILAVLIPVLAINSAFAADLTAPTATIPSAYFGLHIHHLDRPTPTPWPSIPVPEWRLWDADVTWPNLEPNKGQWQFDRLDRYLSLAQKHGTGVLLTLGGSPPWASARPQVPSNYTPGFSAEPANIDDWRTYVRTVASRYKGRIQAYEIWNEPNLPRNRDIGPPARMLELAKDAYTTLKQVDPNIKVISPSPVNRNGLDWMERYFALGGAKYADIIGYHFYVFHRPESMLDLILPAKEIMRKYGVADKPLWNTEAGWIRNSMTERPDPVEQAPGWAARSYILNWAAGVDRFYWYAWDDDGHDVIPFTEEDQATITNSARAYGEIQKWLVGSRMESCERQADENWVCKLTRESGRSAWILWNEEHAAKFDVPKSWEVAALTKLSGEQSAWGGNKIDIGELPIMLEGPPAHH